MTQDVSAGDFVAIKPKHVMTHDNTAAVIKKFTSLGPTVSIYYINYLKWHPRIKNFQNRQESRTLASRYLLLIITYKIKVPKI